MYLSETKGIGKALKEFFNSIQIPLQWYFVLLLVIPSLLGALLIDPKTRAENKQYKIKREEDKDRIKQIRVYREELKQLKNHQDPEWAEKRRQFLDRKLTDLKKENFTPEDILYFFWQIIAVVLAYVAITAVAIIIYSVVRYYSLSLKNTDITIWSIYSGFARTYISLHWKEAILLPCLAAIVAKGLKNTNLKIALCIILSVVLLVSSVLTTTGASKILPMEDEILAELKSNPIIDYSITDITGFKEKVHTGYVSENPTNSDDKNVSNSDEDD